MQNDYKYQVEEVRTAFRYCACRNAVLYPLVRSGEGIPMAMTRLRDLWHARTSVMRDTHWPQVRDPLGLQYARNCPPFGVLTDDTGRCCQIRSVCPFCFARNYVLRPFMFIEQALYGSFHRDAMPKPGYWLVEFEVRQRLCLLAKLPWTPERVMRHLTPWMVEYMQKHRRREVKLCQPEHAAVLHRPYIGERDGVSYGGLSRSGFLLVRAGTDVAATEMMRGLKGKRGCQATMTIHRYPTKSIMSKAATTVFRYQRSMMNFDSTCVAALLAGIKQKHLLSTYGPQIKDDDPKTGFEKEVHVAKRFKRAEGDYEPEPAVVAQKVKDAIGMADDILASIKALPERALEKGDDFFNGVKKRARGIADTIRQTNRVTPAQHSSLDNMLAGVRKWEHVEDED